MHCTTLHDSPMQALCCAQWYIYTRITQNIMHAMMGTTYAAIDCAAGRCTDISGKCLMHKQSNQHEILMVQMTNTPLQSCVVKHCMTVS